jgi:hypothetical protein
MAWQGGFVRIAVMPVSEHELEVSALRAELGEVRGDFVVATQVTDGPTVLRPHGWPDAGLR